MTAPSAVAARDGRAAPRQSFASASVMPENIAAALSRIVVHSAARRVRPDGAGQSRQFDDVLLKPLLDALPAAVYAADAEGYVTYFNQAAVAFAGRAPVIGVDRWCITSGLFRSDGSPLAHEDCPMAVTVRENRIVRGEEAIAERPDGTRVPFMPFPTPIRDRDGALIGAVNVLVDISARKQAESEAAHLALHDTLTGLPNRARFIAHVSERAAARGEPFAILKLDVVGFRHINDMLGHAAGDDYLRAVAGHLRQACDGAFLARTEADKFALAVPNLTDRAELRARLELLRAAARAAAPAKLRPGIRVAIGCALYPDDCDDATTLLARASSALHRAKQHGSDPIVFFDVDADLAERDRQDLKAELAKAIEGGELDLHYQPQFDRDGAPRAFEVLVRWHHPERGMIAPAHFIPLAEEDGGIVAMSEWILFEACREAASWPNRLSVSVNISPMHFSQGDLPELVRNILAATGLEPDRLELEITEGVMVDDFDRTMSILQQLRAIGVRIALDDFGTGYSSLSYLQAFPLNKIKIDRSFTGNLGRMKQSAAIIRAVVGLGHALGLEVAAEGIECREQLDFLLAEDCDLIQGFFTGRPGEIASYAHLTSANQGGSVHHLGFGPPRGLRSA